MDRGIEVVPGVDALGRLASESRYSTAPGMSYGYDAAGRLTSLAITGAGSSSVAWSFAYNPAGEVTSTTRDNDLYAFNGQANVNRGYDPNGLNLPIFALIDGTVKFEHYNSKRYKVSVEPKAKKVAAATSAA